METGLALGMQSMDAAISRLVEEGRIGLEDALARAQDQEKMKKLLAA